VLIRGASKKEVNTEGYVSGKKGFQYPLILLIVFYDEEGERTASRRRASSVGRGVTVGRD
jgi:hypothetical protein